MAHGLKSLWKGLSNGKKCFLVYMQLVFCGDNYGKVIMLYSTQIMKQMSIYGQNSHPKCPKLMHIVHRLFLISAHVQFQVKFVHIPGKLNPIADALSRLQVEKFRKLAPNVEDTPVFLPQVIWLDFSPNGNIPKCSSGTFHKMGLSGWPTPLQPLLQSIGY